MTLRLHRAPRADLLVDGLADVLRVPVADPFARELVIVPAKGVERWVSQRLSHVLGAGPSGDGVCAGVEFRAPRSIVAEVVGSDADDVWSPDALVWPLLEVIDASLGQAWCPALTRHLGHASTRAPGDDPDQRAGRRYSVAHRLARLFATYAVQRPTLMADWESGRDTDGDGAPLDPDLVWQAELWRRVVDRVAQPSPVQRHRSVVEALRRDRSVSSLPSRISLFGHTRIPVTEVELLRALGEQREVDLWLPHPSDALWNALVEPTAGGAVRRRDDRSHLAVGHPLVASLGRDLRELQRTLAGVTTASVTLDDSRPAPVTLLGHLQHDLKSDSVPREPRESVAGDRSVQVHACHGPARQVEVLREALLGLLADDRTLQPRDIVVMCPDIESYAPLLEAAFGLGGVAESGTWHPGQQLQVRLADRSLVQTNPLLAVVGRLLDLAGGRAEASAVLDLAATEPVRRRFGFTDDDLASLGRWVDASGVRWAFDDRHRTDFGLASYPQNTWQFGLDRLLTGIAVSADAERFFGTALPLDDVGSSDIDRAGRLAELVARVRSVTDRLTGTHPVQHWIAALRDGLDLLTAVGWGEEWQLHQAESELAALGVAGDTRLELRLSDVRSLMSERLSGRPTRANFRTGSVTICTMVPMRSVPHRVVCLLGLDDGVFPRAGSLDGDDVLARSPRTGERDARSEDRQLLLDAVMAATEHLLITYSGADEITGRSKPPAVPLGELLDALDLTARDARSAVVVRHRLQPFDESNFGAQGPAFSFDSASRAAATAARGARVEPPRLRDLVLDPAPAADIDLAELGAFLRAPVKEFCRRRLGVNVFDVDDEILDAIPVSLDGLQEWSVGQRMLDDRLRGTSADQALHREWRRGALPPGRLGWERAKAIAVKAEPIVQKALDVRGGLERTSSDVDVDLGHGRRLRGTVTNLHGDRVVGVSYSSLGARHRLDAWLPLLALTAGRPGTPWTAGTVARWSGGARAVVFGGLESGDAHRLLRDLVALYDLGMTRPLRLPLKTGFALALNGEHGRFGARKEWEGTFGFEGENAKDLHPLVWGTAADLALLRTADSSAHTLDTLAARLWRPILDRAATA